MQRWNNAFAWPYYLKTVDIPIVAPFSVANITTTVDSTTATVASSEANSSKVTADDIITDGGSTVVRQTRVTAVSGTNPLTYTLSRDALASGTTSTLTFARSDYTIPDSATDAVNWVYDVRLTSSPRPLVYLNQRFYDSGRPLNEISTPYYYNLFQSGQVGKLRFLPPPNASGTAVMRYHRRIQPTASTLDIPEDWELGIIALAKALMLADKGGNPDRAAYWNAVAADELDKAIARAAYPTPDAQVTFQPAQPNDVAWNPNQRFDPLW